MLPNMLSLSVERKLPVCKRKVRVRGITVKEQKVLITANESHESQKDLLFMMIDTIKACIVGKSTIVVEKLCLVDLMYLFMGIMEISFGSSMKKTYVCKNKVKSTETGEETECGKEFDVTFDLKNVEIVGKVDLEPIKLSESVAVVMDYPSPLTLCEVQDGEYADQTDQLIALLVKCIKSVNMADGTVYDSFTEEEAKDWFSSLTYENFKKISEAFGEMPKLVIKEEHRCPACGYVHKLHFEGIEDFFTFNSQAIL